MSMDQDPLYALTVRLYNSGDYDQARILAKNLLYSRMPDAKYFKMLGAINQATEQYSFAIGAYQRAVLLDCEDEQTAFCLGQCYYHLADYEKAVHWLQISLELQGDQPVAQELLEAILKKMH